MFSQRGGGFYSTSQMPLSDFGLEVSTANNALSIHFSRPLLYSNDYTVTQMYCRKIFFSSICLFIFLALFSKISAFSFATQ